MQASRPKDKEQPGIGTTRRMMDHHACPKTRWDSPEMKNVDRGREKNPAGRRHGEATRAATISKLIMKHRSDWTRVALVDVYIYFYSSLRAFASEPFDDSNRVE